MASQQNLEKNAALSYPDVGGYFCVYCFQWRMRKGENMIAKEVCQVIHLSQNSKTTPIVAEFVMSGKNYLIISDILRYKTYMLSLVVMEKRKLLEKNRIKNEPFTISELKSCIDKDINLHFPKQIMPLILAVREAVSNADIKTGDFIPFKKPIAFGAQTYADQISEYGDDLFSLFGYCGPQIGQVTDFVILGVQVESLF